LANIMKMNIRKFLLTLFILTSYNIIACECIIIKSIQKEFINADYVLTGKIISIEFVQILNNNGKKTKILTSEFRDELDIFKGRVLAKITVETTETLKGKKRKKEKIIYTGSGGGDCGFNFKEGEEYLIYAFKDSWGTKELRESNRKYKNALYTDTCTRTKIIDKKEIENIRLLIE
jgi:mevalonate kinase